MHAESSAVRFMVWFLSLLPPPVPGAAAAQGEPARESIPPLGAPGHPTPPQIAPAPARAAASTYPTPNQPASAVRRTFRKPTLGPHSLNTPPHRVPLPSNHVRKT
jgi:hypothetical protein